METHKRSMTKSIIWRIIGVIVLALVTYAFTGSLIQTSIITFVHHFSFIFIYYFHERLWQFKRLSGIQGKTRSILRMVIYELILGHGVLGAISFIVTGQWTTVTWITITYIENKLWIYVLYDWLWKKSKWEIE